MAETGIWLDDKSHTVIEMFRRTSIIARNKVAFKSGDESYNWRQYLIEATKVSQAILGYKRANSIEGRSKVLIIMNSSPQWLFVNMGAILMCDVPVIVPPKYSEEQIAAIAKETDAIIAFIDAWSDKYAHLAEACPKIRFVTKGDPDTNTGKASVFSLASFEEGGQEVAKRDVRHMGRDMKPEDLCSIVYTEGPEGGLKGYMYSHNNLCYTAIHLGVAADVEPNDMLVQFNPLSHIAEQIASVYMPVRYGCTVCFTPVNEAHKPSLTMLVETLRKNRPSLFFATPRIWEKFENRANEFIKACGGMTFSLRDWAQKKGRAGSRSNEEGLHKPKGYGFARKVVFGKIRQDLGLDRARYCAVNGHLKKETLDYFCGNGINIFPMFGVPETTGIATVSYPKHWSSDAYGVPLYDNVKIKAIKGEIAVKGHNVFMGYFNDDELTKKYRNAKGDYVLTGECGDLEDRTDFLRITKRKRVMYITSGGETLAPIPVEALLRKIPGVEHAMIIGDNEMFFTAFFVIDKEKLKAGMGAAKAAKGSSSSSSSSSDDDDDDNNAPKRDPKKEERDNVNTYLRQQVEALVNVHLSPTQGIKKFAVIHNDATDKSSIVISDNMSMDARYKAFEKYKEIIAKVYGYYKPTEEEIKKAEEAKAKAEADAKAKAKASANASAKVSVKANVNANANVNVNANVGVKKAESGSSSSSSEEESSSDESSSSEEGGDKKKAGLKAGISVNVGAKAGVKKEGSGSSSSSSGSSEESSSEEESSSSEESGDKKKAGIEVKANISAGAKPPTPKAGISVNVGAKAEAKKEESGSSSSEEESSSEESSSSDDAAKKEATAKVSIGAGAKVGLNVGVKAEAKKEESESSSSGSTGSSSSDESSSEESGDKKKAGIEVRANIGAGAGAGAKPPTPKAGISVNVGAKAEAKKEESGSSSSEEESSSEESSSSEEGGDKKEATAKVSIGAGAKVGLKAGVSVNVGAKAEAKKEESGSSSSGSSEEESSSEESSSSGDETTSSEESSSEKK